MKCPKCGSTWCAPCEYQKVEGESGQVRKSVKVMCGECGHTWDKLIVESLKELYGHQVSSN